MVMPTKSPSPSLRKMSFLISARQKKSRVARKQEEQNKKIVGLKNSRPNF